MNAQRKSIVRRSRDRSTKVPRTFIHRIEADGVRVFYREAGAPDRPVVLLLHGFPTSSFQYRELIPRLADRYRVLRRTGGTTRTQSSNFWRQDTSCWKHTSRRLPLP